MRRRNFLTLLGSTAATWPLAVRAHALARMRRIGMMMGAFRPSDPEGQRTPATFLDTMESLGWTLGGDFEVNTCWPADDADRSAAAAELVSWAPDVLFCRSRPAADVLARATQSIPIVLAERRGVVAVTTPRFAATGVGLAPARSDYLNVIRRAGARVDRILRGERLVETVSPNLHVITDEVIE